MSQFSRIAVLLLLTAVFASAQENSVAGDSGAEAGRKVFGAVCAGCHGATGEGGERGPDIVSTRQARRRTDEDLARIMREGIPSRGMPAFPLAAEEIQQVTAFLNIFTAPAISHPTAGNVALGEDYFFGAGGCGGCHSIAGRGGFGGPPLSGVAETRTLAEIERSLRDPGKEIASGYQAVHLRLRQGGELRGFLRNESGFDLQLQTFDGVIHMLWQEEVAELSREEGSRMPALKASPAEFRDLMAFLTRLPQAAATGEDRAALPGAVPFQDIVDPKPGDWPSYHGRLSGNRHSPLDQIDTANVRRLAPRWSFPIRSPRDLETTPLVADGVMYVTTVNQIFALDARTGREIWRYQRPRSEGVIGDAGSGINRGVAILGDRVFLATDDAHLLALHRVNGELLWDAQMASSEDHYGATSAPLAVKDLVIAGVSGGDEGIRGFLDAYRASTGERVWRFWTVPAPGEPLADTWEGGALPHGCAATWLTGSYDPDTNLLFWPTGNPCPDYDGVPRRGDNLYSNSALALDPDTGQLRWHYQFTPHDLHDWDATETLLLADAEFRGRARKLLMQANRNGFFYVLDRGNGELLLAKPFVRELTWATGIGEDGRPQRLEESTPSAAGARVCPAVEGATNWMSTAYNPATNLFYVQAQEKCNIFTRSPEEWTPGQSFYGGTTRSIPGETGEKYLRALRPETGEIVWERKQVGPGRTWGGVLSTAGGLVFYGDDSGAFVALDAGTGKPLWNFHANVAWKASPMTYFVDGRQYIAVAAGSQIIAFALADSE
jgi:alcohol dehydrogenase (cytochrome c)